MTIQRDYVLWDNGQDRLCLLQVPFEHQYQYIGQLPCITVGISYENANYKGCDIFTLFDHFYASKMSEIEKVYLCLNGAFRINDNAKDTDGYIDFTIKNGFLSVQGQLGASFSPHSLRFEFEADQTLVGTLLQALTI